MNVLYVQYTYGVHLTMNTIFYARDYDTFALQFSSESKSNSSSSLSAEEVCCSVDCCRSVGLVICALFSTSFSCL